MVLDTELSGTPAGEALGRMRAHADTVRLSREQRLASESPQAVEERRRVKRAQRATVQAQRHVDKRSRDIDRLKLLETLTLLSPAERLSRFATDTALNLDAVPTELIPAQEMDLVDLERAQLAALLMRISQRRGAWGRLRRMLKARVDDEPKSLPEHPRATRAP